MPGPNGASYVTPAQLGQYLPAAALALATSVQQLQACSDATARADSYMSDRYQMPLLAWDAAVTQMTAYVACYLLMDLVGWAPQAGADTNVRSRYYEAVGYPDRPGSGWFPGVARQAIHPDVTPSIPVGQDPGHDGPQVSSQPMRGWQQVRGGRSVVGGF